MKWLFFMFLAGFILVVGVGGFGYFYMKSTEPPVVKAAPWVIQTYSQDEMKIPSRVYYASEVDIIDGQPVINSYWIQDGNKYKKQNNEITLPENSKIIRRAQ